MALSIKVSGNLVQVFDSGQLVGSRRIESNASRSLVSSGLLKVNNVTYTPEEVLRVPVSSSISGQPVSGTVTGGASSLEVSTARSASDPTQSTGVFGPPVSLATTPGPEGTDPFSFLTVDQLREIIFSTESSPEEVRRASAILAAGGGAPDSGGGTGRTGPTAAELAIERSRIDATNLATFITGTVAELEIEVDSKRLSTEQAIGEFNRRLDAFAEAGKQFIDIQPSTIPIGAEFAPGFGPGEVGEQLGIAPRRAQTVQFDPFAEAANIVNQTPVLTDIGVPSGDALAQAVELARQFTGG